MVKPEHEEMKQIDIRFAAGNGGQNTVPVFYAVENREEDCTQIFRCTIGLPPARLPSWLHTTQFDLVTYVRDGVQLVYYNASRTIEPCTLEAEAFRYKVYAEIFFQERKKERDKFAHC